VASLKVRGEFPADLADFRRWGELEFEQEARRRRGRGEGEAGEWPAFAGPTAWSPLRFDEFVGAGIQSGQVARGRGEVTVTDGSLIEIYVT